jgi:hypothetical protein
MGTMSRTWRTKSAIVSGERFNVCCAIADGVCAMASACRVRLKPMAACEVIRQLEIDCGSLATLHLDCKPACAHRPTSLTV